MTGSAHFDVSTVHPGGPGWVVGVLAEVAADGAVVWLEGGVAPLAAVGEEVVVVALPPPLHATNIGTTVIAMARRSGHRLHHDASPSWVEATLGQLIDSVVVARIGSGTMLAIVGPIGDHATRETGAQMPS